MAVEARRNERWPLIAGLLASAAILATIDLVTPGGTAVWILYIILIALSLYSRKPRFPFVLAAVCTMLVVLDRFQSPHGDGALWINSLARAFGVTTFWVVAYIMSTFILTQKTFEDNEVIAQALSEKLATEAWLRKGLTAINEAMRGVQSSEDLCRNLLAQMAEFVGAKIGSFYLADELNCLNRVAIYGYSSVGSSAATIPFGEGLLGQAAGQLKMLELSDVPPEYYLKIKSSLGEITPRYIVAIPVLFDRRLIGVMELGSLEPFSAVSRSLFDIVPENIGIAIDLTTSRRRQQKFLAESQSLNLQLQAAQKTFEDNEIEAQKLSEKLASEAWLRKGLTAINEAMRGVQSSEVLCRNLLAQMAEFVGAKIGSFYLAEDGGSLKRAAIYAYADSSGEAELFAPHEGLLGQAAAQLKMIELSDVPSDYYMKIRSSLGEVTPRYIVAIPVLFDGRLNGVMELGSVEPFSANARLLFEIIPENIGIAIDLTTSRRHQRELLGRSQELSERLQTQQEELRAANQELTAQASKLEAQQAALEETNAALEGKQQLLEEQKEALQDTNALLQSSKREIELASQYKSEFLSNMSHELRTPLNSILILAQMLSDNKRGTLSNDEVDSALTIVLAGNDLLALINDILDLSKIESGTVDLEPEMVNLEALTDHLERVFRPTAEKKGLALEVTIGASVAKEIFTDRQRLEQIIKNLLSNALKFTAHGTVGLRVWHSPDGPRTIAIAVSDTGIGIAKDKQEVIFEAFKQADGTTARRFGGTGLGLSISRELAVLLQCEISLESVEGEGSTFTLFLPERMKPREKRPSAVENGQAGPTRPAARPTAAPTVQRPRVAAFRDDRDTLAKGDKCMQAIEDEPAFAQILVRQAHELGFKCVLSEDGESGLADARHYLPSGIILDVKLPGLSGMEVLEHLKKDPATRHIPVHVVSGFDHRKNALHLGAVGFLMKPIDAKALSAAFLRLERAASGTLKKVLIAEDNETQLNAMRSLISDLKDVETVGVRSGKEALDQLRTTAFDCMILDLRLPDMSGMKVLEEMAKNSSLSHPPVIVYTGTTLSRLEEENLRRYTDSIIIKGARSPERLLDEMVLFLHRIESELPPGKRQILKELRDRNQVLAGAMILLVDDDMRNVFALSRLIEDQGASVSVARNGQEALDRLEKNPDHNLVLMDIMMPIMDGFEAMKRIRAQPRFGKLPIIALTAKAMKGDQEKCIEAGASDYLAKPIDAKRLLSLVSVWLAPQGF